MSVSLCVYVYVRVCVACEEPGMHVCVRGCVDSMC